LKTDEHDVILDKSIWPLQVQNKPLIYGSNKCEEDSSEDEGMPKGKKESMWYRPRNIEIKLIDFGGATYENEHHTKIINTR
jgi:hypothetical protein